MANPWNPSLFTNASQVKTNTPDEVNALKQVNLDRPRLLCSGNTVVVNGIVPDGAGDFGPIAIRWIETGVLSGVYSNATGEYTCAEAGYYRIDLVLNNFLLTPANLDFLGFYIETKHGAGAWTMVKRLEPIGPFIVGQYWYIFAGVLLAVGDKVRISFSGHYTTAGNRSITNMSPYDSNYYIEFVRTP